MYVCMYVHSNYTANARFDHCICGAQLYAVIRLVNIQYYV